MHVHAQEQKSLLLLGTKIIQRLEINKLELAFCFDVWQNKNYNIFLVVFTESTDWRLS